MIHLHSYILHKTNLLLSGTFGARLMKKYSVCKEAQILFTENHWQTEDTMKLYIHHLKLHFRDKDKLGLILDEAKMHNCESLNKYVEDTNKYPPTITLGFIAKNLTAVHSPPDQSTIKILKKEIRTKYEKEMHANDFQIGSTFRISRDKVIEITTDSFKQINDDNDSDPFIRRAFDYCGLNPHLNNTDAFEKHLTTLTQNNIYKRLMDKNYDRNMSGLIDTP